MAKRIFDIDLDSLKYLGKGVEGKVFMTPDGRALKAYNDMRYFEREYKLMKRLEGSPYIPRILACKGRFMLREYVGGIPIKEYIKKNGLSDRLSINLIEFAEYIEDSGLRVDGITNHVFIQEDESIKIIDPRKKQYRIHASLLRALKELNVMEDFLKVLKLSRPDLMTRWSKTIYNLSNGRW